MSLQSTKKQQAVLRDSHLVSAELEGSADAFGELQRIYSRQLYRTIVGITKNHEDAEDALQDTFLRAYLALRNFEGRSSFYSWLTRIAINSALMVLRKRRTRPELSFDPQNETEDNLPLFEIKDTRPNPEQIYDQRQRCISMLCAIQELEPGVGNALQLRIAHGLSMTEIAQTLDLSVAAVKSRLYRARVRLNATPVSRNAGTRRHTSSDSKCEGLIPASEIENSNARPRASSIHRLIHPR